MKKFRFWLKSIWIWVKKANYLWLALSAVTLSIFYINLNSTEQAVRISGLILQLLGIATVAWGIKETREQFGHPSLLTQGVQWLLDFPPYGGKVVTCSMHGILAGATGNARAHTLHPINPNSSIEERLNSIEKNISLINNRITQAESETDRKTSEISEGLKTEKLTRENSVKEINTKIESTSTGGLHISAIGALWLFAGVTLSTIPNEILSYLK